MEFYSSLLMCFLIFFDLLKKAPGTQAPFVFSNPFPLKNLKNKNQSYDWPNFEVHT